MNKRVPDHNVHSSEKNPALEKLVHPKPMRTTCRCITESSLNSRIIGTNKYGMHLLLKKQSLSIRELLPMDEIHIDHFVFILPRESDLMPKAVRIQTHAFVDSMNPVNIIEENSAIPVFIFKYFKQKNMSNLIDRT